MLVTGASGFLGRRVLARLAAGGEPIRVLIRKPAPWMDKLANSDGSAPRRPSPVVCRLAVTRDEQHTETKPTVP